MLVNQCQLEQKKIKIQNVSISKNCSAYCLNKQTSVKLIAIAFNANMFQLKCLKRARTSRLSTWMRKKQQMLLLERKGSSSTYLSHSSSLSASCFQTQAARHRSVAFKCDRTETATSGGKWLRSGKDSSWIPPSLRLLLRWTIDCSCPMRSKLHNTESWLGRWLGIPRNPLPFSQNKTV